MFSTFRVKKGVAIAAVVCGQSPSNEELLIMIKSAILFQGSSELTFIIFCETNMQASLAEEVSTVIMWYEMSFKSK